MGVLLLCFDGAPSCQVHAICRRHAELDTRPAFTVFIWKLINYLPTI